MVLDPEGALLTRIWCLYEVWQSIKAGDKLRVLLYGLHLDEVEKVGMAVWWWGGGGKGYREEWRGVRGRPVDAPKKRLEQTF